MFTSKLVARDVRKGWVLPASSNLLSLMMAENFGSTYSGDSIRYWKQRGWKGSFPARYDLFDSVHR